ncbi:MAG: type II TA system antitoxin MqsA family protein [Candidatus Omnitrophota bacterium]
MKSLYCPKCDEVQEVDLISKREEYEVRGDKFSINAEIYVCKKCGEDIFDEEMDTKNLMKLYDSYRKTNELLMPDEIKALRSKYGLSQRAMSRLLKWGEVTYTRYENGAVQDNAHNEVLELIQDPENMSKIYEKNKEELLPNERKTLERKLKELIAKEMKPTFINLFEGFLSDFEEISEYTGYKKFDLEKVKEIILYMLGKNDGIMKTKINKLMWYIDFLFFKTNSVSMSGSRYIHLPYGPIPDNYDEIIALMAREGLVKKEEVIFDEEKGIVGEKVISVTSDEKNNFSPEELEVMDYCIDYFKDFTCGKISRYSHEEEPYKETEEQKPISYNMATKISLTLA